MKRTGLILTIILAVLFAAPPAWAAPLAQEGREPLPLLWWLTPIAAIIGLAVAFMLYKSVMSHSEGTARMIEIAQAVREGAMAYLNRQYRIVAIVTYYEFCRPAKFYCAFCFCNRRPLFGGMRFYRYENSYQRIGPNCQRSPKQPKRRPAGGLSGGCSNGVVGCGLCPVG